MMDGGCIIFPMKKVKAKVKVKETLRDIWEKVIVNLGLSFCYGVWMICCVILSLCPGSTHLTNWRGWLLVFTNWTTFKTGPPRVTWHLLGRATGWRTFGRGASDVAGESLVVLSLRVYCLLCIVFWDFYVESLNKRRVIVPVPVLSVFLFMSP